MSNVKGRRKFLTSAACLTTGLFIAKPVLKASGGLGKMGKDSASAPKKFVPVMITPYHSDNTIDFETLGSLTDFYINAGAKGLFANCASSEMYQLNNEERLSLARFVVKRVNGSVPVVATGSFGETLEEKAAFVKSMYHTGVQAVILITSHFAGATESDAVLFNNFEKILSLTDNIPLGLYECPSPYKRILSPEIFKKILDTHRFFYHKDTTLDPEKVKAKIALVGNNRLEFYDAHAPNTLSSLQAGARGMSVIAGNIYPEIFSWLCANAMDPSKKETLQWLQAEITRTDSIISDGYPMSAKYMLRKRGLPIQLFCRNAGPLSVTQMQQLDKVYSEMLGWCNRLQIKAVQV